MDDKTDLLVFPPARKKSPTFSRDEVQELVNIIDKNNYKHILMNRSLNASALESKELVWEKIARAFNTRKFKHYRTVESLKMKWDNLKKTARKLSKNLIDVDSDPGYREINAQVVSIMCEATNTSAANVPSDLEDEIEDDTTEEPKTSTNDSENGWEDNAQKQLQDDTVDEQKTSDGRKTINFSPNECSLLLQCVKQEKKHIFNKNTSHHAVTLRKSAWSRVTAAYNKQSPTKRSTRMLHNKFTNMKKMVNKVGFKEYLKGITRADNQHKRLLQESCAKKIKNEPNAELATNGESDWNDDYDDNTRNSPGDQKSHEYFMNIPPDPLSSVLNGDSGLGSSYTGSLYQSENQEVVKLRMELLNYQMETAKLDRKRLERQFEEDESARQSRAAESALRLRAARLEAIAAEMRFPSAHPALFYPPEEAKAQEYLAQYHHTAHVLPLP